MEEIVRETIFRDEMRWEGGHRSPRALEPTVGLRILC